MRALKYWRQPQLPLAIIVPLAFIAATLFMSKFDLKLERKTTPIISRSTLGVASPESKPIKILIGIFTTAFEYERRTQLRALYVPLQKRAPLIQIKYIIGRDDWQSVNQHALLENREYNDLIILDMEEV